MTESEITRLLRAARSGDQSAHDRLVPIVYDELRLMARTRLAGERSDHSLRPTELVHEAYLRLVQGDPKWENRAHFFGAASRAMRRVLVDHARSRSALKRGGEVRRVTLGDVVASSEDPDVDLMDLDAALTALEAEDQRLSQVVHLRYFTGLSIEQVAEVLGVSPATVKRDWMYARTWLYERMGR